MFVCEMVRGSYLSILLCDDHTGNRIQDTSEIRKFRDLFYDHAAVCYYDVIILLCTRACFWNE